MVVIRPSVILLGLGTFFALSAIPVAVEYVLSMIPPSGMTDDPSPVRSEIWTRCLGLTTYLLLAFSLALPVAALAKYYRSQRIDRFSN